jgi:hypothetical protein
MSLAKELERLADRLEQAAGKQTTRGALGKLAWEYAVLAGDRLLQAEQAGAIQDAALLAQIAIQHPDEQARRNYAFLNVVQKWLPTVAPDHRPDKHDAAHRYADDLRALAGAIGKLTPQSSGDGTGATEPADGDLGTEERALALLVKNPGWNQTRMAKAVGVNRTTLYKFGKYQAAREALKTGKADIPHGSKDKDGNLEAWEGDTFGDTDDEQSR